MGLFKTYQHNGVVLTNANTKFVCPLSGSDGNSGTREFPYATLTKVYAGNNLSFTLLKGSTVENLSVSANGNILISDDKSTVYGNSSDSQYAYTQFGITFSGNVTKRNWDSAYIFGSIVKGYLDGMCRGNGNFINEYRGFATFDFKNNTIFRFLNYSDQMQNSNILSNSILIESIDLYNFASLGNVNYRPIFKYCLFRKATVWKWNGVTVPINYGTYGNVAGDYLADVISAMYAYTGTVPVGAERTYFSAMFPNGISSPIFYVGANGQTCKVVEDRPSVEGSKKIFNRYIGDNPVDYSLFLHAENVALIMSDELSYVGCYKANADVLTFGDVMSVNVDGSDDLITPPDMLIYDGNGKFRVSIADSVQIRNRVRSSIFHFKRGFTLDGFQSQMKSGLSSRFSIGKFQPYNITDAPTLPQESIEVIPYDDAVTPSAFPRFSAMFNDKVQMWYHTAGAKKDLPVLFNDLLAYFAIVTDKSLAEYGTWAVTNADYETFALSTKANVKLQNVPVYFAQVEINLNYHV